MTQIHDRSAVSWIERVVLLLLVLYLGCVTLPRAAAKLNTDFPNYYLTVRLASEGVDVSRAYEWTWLQREKDHEKLPVKLVALSAITPFSTLTMWPLVKLPALTAKKVWLLFNLVLLVPLGWMLRSMTGLSYQRIVLVFAASVPLQHNMLDGQFYLLLLALIVTACWAWLRGNSALAGALIAIAACCKVFPLLFFLSFLRRRDFHALFSGVVVGVACVGVSVAVFGWNLHHTYFAQVFPWALRGEGMQPYITSSQSISGLLHFLFLYEPQWNPYPWHSSPLAFSLLDGVLPMLALAPAILLIRREDRSARRVLLEWSGLLTASLAVSTLPASYHFVLMAFPFCVVGAYLLQQKRYGWLVTLVVAYLGISLPVPAPHGVHGLAILFFAPRLWLMFALLAGIYALLWREPEVRRLSWGLERWVWVAAMAMYVVFDVRGILRLERAVRSEYTYRLPTNTQTLLNATPQRIGADILSIAFDPNGYRLMREASDAAARENYFGDELSFGGNETGVWVERADGRSEVVDVRNPSRVALQDARDPMLGTNGRDLAFLRDDHGRGRLMVRRGFRTDTPEDVVLTGGGLDVYEASFRSETKYAFSATVSGGLPQIYLTDADHSNAPLGLGESRYPALSPDGRWMAYSHFEQGMWNLWVRDQQTGATTRVADVPCNQVEPSWEGDSKTVLYGTDCGRSLNFIAIARRRVIP